MMGRKGNLNITILLSAYIKSSIKVMFIHFKQNVLNTFPLNIALYGKFTTEIFSYS